jgi:hypothetical protein
MSLLRAKDVIVLRTLVVYESMYGNTHAVALSIADGLRSRHEVTVVPVSMATRDLVAAADLLVAGGPTHMHAMSSASSRRRAVDAANKQEELGLDPDAPGPGLHGWLERLSANEAFAAAFDTRLTGIPALTGRASRGISRLLQRHGYHVIAEPVSFLVTKQNVLLDGELSRARAWGTGLGLAAADARAAAS